MNTYNCEECDIELVGSAIYCDTCYDYLFCECGNSLGEYRGDGFCKSCQ